MHAITPQDLALAGRDVTLFTGRDGSDAKPRAVPLVRRALRLAMRWKWVLVAGVVGGALLGLVGSLMMTRQYSSTARLEISRETARVVKIDSVERDPGIGDQEFYQTQYGLLQTQQLAERVASDLGVVDDPRFFAMFGRRNLFEGNADDQSGPSRRAKRREIAGRILLLHVGVAPVRGSSLVDVTVITPDPALSQRIAGLWAQDFIAGNIERRFQKSSYARQFLEKRLAQLQQRLEVAERQAVEYASQQGIINLPTPGGNGKDASSNDRSLATDDLISLNTALEEATVARIQAETRLREAAHPDASTESLGNTAIATLRQKRAEAAADYSKLLVQAQPAYPQARALASQIGTIDAALAQEEGRIRTSLRQAYAVAQARERNLFERVKAAKGSLVRLRHDSIQYNIYQRDADTTRELYGALLQRYKEIGVAGNIESNNVVVVDEPKLPDRPSSPNLAVNVILAMLAGLVAGTIAALLLDQIDEAIADPSEIVEKLGVPLLGSVPRVASGAPLEALRDPRSELVESYLAIQANLDLATAHGMPHSFAVVSTRPREGKSTTTAALAQSLARARRRVVLIDADLRSPSVHTMFGLPNGVGVSSYLAGSDEIEAAVHATDRDGLWVMTAGPQPPNAADLLTGDRLAQLVRALQARFDHVIVDSPPVIGLADAPLVASAVESVVFVVEAGSSQAGAVRTALDRLRMAQVKVLGAVLTKFAAKRGRLGYGYEYGYGYGYGKSEAA